MNTNYRENIIYACKCIHYSINISIYVFCNEELLYISSKFAPTATKILFDEYPSLTVLDRNTKYQIIKNDYHENYFIVSIKEENILVIIGPFINEEINEGMITNLMRKGLIPFHKKTEISDFYKSLPLLNEDRMFYISKLIENVIDNIENDISSESKTPQQPNISNEEFYTNVKQNRLNAFSHSSYKDEQKISETIKNGDIENAMKLLKQINITPHAKLAQDDIRSYKNSMICSCTFMTRAAIAGGVNANDAFTMSDTYINKIENIQNLTELENFESVMVKGFVEMVNSKKTNEYTRSILNAMNYIQEHLCENIKISDIAKASYLNPSYLSYLFHKETNMTISEWILRKRIEEASFSLSNTNEEIADIAFFYNFCSQSYFVKCFKKIKGITPNEYRKNKTKGTT